MECDMCKGLGHIRTIRCPKCEGGTKVVSETKVDVVTGKFELPERGPICLPELNIYDASSLSDFMRCPFFFHQRYVKKLKTPWDDAALTFGGAIHEGLAQLLLHDWDVERAKEHFRNYPGLASLEDPKRNLDNGENVLEKYAERWKGETDITLVEDEDGPFVERAFLLSVSDEKRSGMYAGRIDSMVKLANMIYPMDHKTTSGMHYIINNMRPNFQFDGYVYAGEQTFGHCAGVIVDAIELGRSGIKFNRIPSPRSQYEIERFAVQFLNLVEHVQLCKATGEWPQFTTHCWEYFKRCPYENLCMHNSDVGLEVRDGAATLPSSSSSPDHIIV